MPERRTTVTVDFQVGNIDLGSGDVTIPATVDPGGGTGGGGGGGTGGPGESAGWQDAFQRTFGTRTTARILAFFRNLGPLLLGVIKQFPLLTVVIGAVVSKLALLYAQAKLAIYIFQQLGKVGLWALQQLWEGAKKATDAFVNLAKYAIQMSIEALKRFTQEVVNLGKAVGQHILRFLKTSVGMFSNFEQSVANAVAAMALVGPEADAMREQVMHATKEATASSIRFAYEAADAFSWLIRAGFEAAEVFNMIDHVVALSEATLTSMDVSVGLLASTLRQFRIDAAESARVVDSLVAATLGAPGTLQDVRNALDYVGSSARMLNISLEDTLAMVMALERQGRKGSKAGMELQNVLKSLIAPTNKARKVLGDLGVDVDRLSDDIITKGMIPALKQIEHLGGRLQAAFGTKEGEGFLAKALLSAETMRAGRGLAGLLAEGTKQMSQMSKEVTSTATRMETLAIIMGTADEAVGATGLAAKIQAEQLRTLQGAWMQLKSLWEDVYYDVTQPFAKALAVMVLHLRDLVAQAREAGIWERFAEALKGLMYIGQRLVLVLGPHLLAAIDDLIGILPEAVAQIGRAIHDLLPTVIAAIKQVPQILGEVIGRILPMLLKFVTTVVPLLLRFAMTVIPLLISVFQKFGGVVTSFLAKNGDKLVAWFGFLLETGLKLLAWLPSLMPLFERLIGAFMTWGTYLANVALPMLPQFLRIIEKLVPVFGQLAATVLPMVLTALQQVANIIEAQGISAFKELVTLILQVAQTALEAMCAAEGGRAGLAQVRDRNSGAAEVAGR